MKFLLGLLLGLCVVSLAQEETDPSDRLACLDEHQRSQPISETARCNANGELYDPYEGFNIVTLPSATPADQVAAGQRFDEAYAKLTPYQREEYAKGNLWWNGYDFSVAIHVDRGVAPPDRLACLDEHQRSQPISETARCNADGELYDPFEGHNIPAFDPDILTDAQVEAMLQRYQQTYDALPPWRQQLVDEGKLHFDGFDAFVIPP